MNWVTRMLEVSLSVMVIGRSGGLLCAGMGSYMHTPIFARIVIIHWNLSRILFWSKKVV
jgi:hypothetical protein